MKKFRTLLNKSEKGQAIILIAFAFVGLVAMVGLVTDTGLLLIEYGKLKRSVDAAAIGAAQQYRVISGSSTVNKQSLEDAAINYLNLNQVQNISNVIVRSCEDTGADRPALCNPIGGDAINNRKLVQVTASSDVRFGFLRVIGFKSVTLSATAVGEAATMDLVLIMDTSAGMAYETGTDANCELADDNPANECYSSQGDDDPSICNLNNSCQPMAAVKEVAIDFINTMYFPYDRVAIITMTSQTPSGERTPEIVLDLNSNKTTIVNAINNIKVFEPRDCDPVSEVTATGETGLCLRYDGNDGSSGNFLGDYCEIYNDVSSFAFANPSSCPSSNVGGTLYLAQDALTAGGDEDLQRLDAFWVVVALFSGPANATDTEPATAVNYPFGYCPMNTWLLAYSQGPWCRDKYSSTRHPKAGSEIMYTNPQDGSEHEISLYDAEDYARDRADELAGMVSGNGVTIYTIGLGKPVQRLQKINGSPAINPNTSQEEPAPAEALFEYIAEEAGGEDVNHGQYFFAPSSGSLEDIFERIAKNIATKISQ